MVTRIIVVGALLGFIGMPLHGAPAAAAVVSSADAAHTIFINALTVSESTVSGTVVNTSPATVHGVEVLLRQAWQWNNERHPGTDNPGRTLHFTLAGDVAPHASAPFTLQIPPLPQRSDGRFVTTMDVTGFTEVGP